jgi:hypothetical protein
MCYALKTMRNMKTLAQIKSDYKSRTLDGRDLTRLTQFIPEAELIDFGVELKPEYVGKHVHIELTKENILNQLKDDVSFGFEKALNKRGISSALMFEVVRMWNWILEDGLEDWSDDNYAMYGLPLFKATAVKYGFENPIGEDTGSEDSYNEQ